MRPSGRSLPDQVWLVPDSSRILHWFVSTKMPLTTPDGEVVGLAGVMRDAQSAGSWLGPYSDMSPVLDHVMRHFNEKLRVGDLADMVNLSVSQFERRFAKRFGMTPIAYILRVRLNESARLLVQTPSLVGAIAQQCGFYDQSSFTRLFGRQYGQTPTTYRQAHRRSFYRPVR
jgi:AraC-like DNA-binding protein